MGAELYRTNSFLCQKLGAGEEGPLHMAVAAREGYCAHPSTIAVLTLDKWKAPIYGLVNIKKSVGTDGVIIICFNVPV